MRAARRSSIAALVALALLASSPLIARAAPRQTASPAQATPADAKPFVGDWTINAESPMGPATLQLSVMEEGGVVRARMKGGEQGESSISDVRAQAQSLVLRYTFDYQGQPIPTVVVLTPQAESTLGADFSMIDGQFEMKGVGRRPGQATAAPPATGAAPSVSPRAAAPAAQPPAADRRAQPQTPRVVDLMQMMAALPAEAPARPKQPRKVLVLARAAGFVHASIPLAARTVEALGQKTGAWDTVITYDAADITAENLKQYDAIFLASTTGEFLDDPDDKAATSARRTAIMDFVRGGKGIAAIHAATDSYHGAPAGAAEPPAGAPRVVDGGQPLWPEWNRLINGYFKWHWNHPTQIYVKVEDPTHPLNAPFTSYNPQTKVRIARPFAVVDEVYAFNQNSWDRSNARVLTSLDYSRMPAEVKAQEPAPQRTDQDYALSYIRREGKGRVFVEVLGHVESIYKMPAMLAHILAGVQYVLGDLEADDTPGGPRASQ
jgi:type 1 glutamine amidotransferase